MARISHLKRSTMGPKPKPTSTAAGPRTNAYLPPLNTSKIGRHGKLGKAGWRCSDGTVRLILPARWLEARCFADPHRQNRIPARTVGDSRANRPARIPAVARRWATSSNVPDFRLALSATIPACHPALPPW